MTDERVERVLLISGKRKSGKDFISQRLSQIIGEDDCTIVRISEPIKSHYANQNNLSLSELMSETTYKEKYRQEMIIWSDQIRLNDPGYFCKAACSKALLKPTWIVSDIRRRTDLKWFKETFGNKVKTIRINAGIDVRKNRGWIFTKGVDDVTSECDLDDYTGWDLSITNNTEEDCNQGLEQISNLLK